MSSRLFPRVSVLFLSAILAGCGGTTEQANITNTANVNAVNAGNSATNNNNPLAVATPTPKETTNNAPTLTPVFKAYCAAMEKKDEAALRRLFSSQTIKFFEEDMKETGDKTLVQYFSGDKTTTALCEVRNENITGDTAVAEIKTQAYPTGIEIEFVRENGQWKLTNRSPAVPRQK